MPHTAKASFSFLFLQMRRTHDGFMKCGSSKNLVYSLHRSDISLFTCPRTNGGGEGGVEEGWGNKSQAHLLVSASFFPLFSIFIIELDSLNATDESAARGGGEKMRADRTAGCQRVLGEDVGGRGGL